MGNCNVCVRADDIENQSTYRQNNKKKTGERRPNPFSEDAIRSPAPIRVLKDVIPLSHRTRIGDKYILGRELGRGEFGITYLCTDRETKEALACKSISKRKLRTAVGNDIVLPFPFSLFHLLVSVNCAHHFLRSGGYRGCEARGCDNVQFAGAPKHSEAKGDL